jgi:hypothetical protein
MQRVIASIVGIGVFVAIGSLAIFDLTSSPPLLPPDSCTLVRRLLLPDTCVCSTSGGTCIWASTRPYLIFFTQAVSCPTLCDIRIP